MSAPLTQHGHEPPNRLRAEPATEHRTLAIELDGVLRPVPGHYHRSGPFTSRLITAAHFRGSCEIGGECPVPVRMALHRPRASIDRRLIVLDDLSTQWVMSFATCHDHRLYKITGFY
ncbi:hypothetical protein [Streptomyces sp. NBC_01205]|uniref:hypothetical protein n=1 Tax=Streptomyces sp. NBC_01205 TaxID=2903771 RepID=UPI002E12B3AF|nr:hypothetical protein OG573_43360 [Streptomyces sp. NBC_01205]